MLINRIWLLLVAFVVVEAPLYAQKVTLTWPMDGLDYQGECIMSGDASAQTHLTSTDYAVGNKLSVVSVLTQSSAETGYTSVTYPHPMLAFQPSAKVSGATSGHTITFSVSVEAGHTFKPTLFTFNAAKVGTDGGGLIIRQKIGNGPETDLAEVSPRRNKITASESIGYTDGVININDVIFDGRQTYSIIVYLAGNLATNKQLALGYCSLQGAVDESVYDLSHFISALTCQADGETIDLWPRVKALNNGDRVLYNVKLHNEPTDFTVTPCSGYEANISYAGKEALLTVTDGGESVYQVTVGFMTTRYQKHTNATPLNRGLMAVNLVGKGNLISWRARQDDVYGSTHYCLYRSGTLIADLDSRTNYLDAEGSLVDQYRVEVCDSNGQILEQQEGVCVWNGQMLDIALQQAPIDTNGTGASYTPNDATTYDMDGDGEQEIIFRWEPSNVRDGANTGTTGAVWLECVKLDGTQLWRINLGQNIWASQHTVTFLCYDFDGDGFGEMICRTAPGTRDGEGNFVVMGDDNPYTSYVSSRGRVEDGPEYLTVFDGMTGAAISSMHYWPSHADFGSPAQNESKYGSQARIERYNATMARLDVNGRAVPCAVMNHGYYSAAYYMAATYDGTEIREVWRSAFEQKNQGMFGQGYHTLQSADVDGDGFDEIVVGSGVMDHDGSAMWRSGEGHGDALHVGDFDWNNPGLEVFSIMEDYDASNVTFCMDMRDARTGQLLWGWPKGDRDCGRGIAADFAPEYDGAEAMSARSSYLHTFDGEEIVGTNVTNDGKNFRIYWTGDLYDENLDGTWISKWNGSNKRFVNIAKLETLAALRTINGTKNVPCLQADILGDYREELIYYYDVNAGTGQFGLRILATNYESEYMLPYLRDDALYDNAVVWQNTTYNQPPHLSYSPVQYYKLQLNTIERVESDAVTPAAQPCYNMLGQRVNGATARGLIINAGCLIINK